MVFSAMSVLIYSIERYGTPQSPNWQSSSHVHCGLLARRILSVESGRSVQCTTQSSKPGFLAQNERNVELDDDRNASHRLVRGVEGQP
jgi:hypothetical protein